MKKSDCTKDTELVDSRPKFCHWAENIQISPRTVDPSFQGGYINDITFCLFSCQIKEASSKILNTLVIIHAKVRIQSNKILKYLYVTYIRSHRWYKTQNLLFFMSQKSERVIQEPWNLVTDDYAKDGGLREVWILCSLYHEPLRTWIKTNINKFAISSHTAMKLGKQALNSYLKIICEFQLRSSPIRKLVPQGIMVKTTWSSDYPWSAILA